MVYFDAECTPAEAVLCDTGLTCEPGKAGYTCGTSYVVLQLFKTGLNQDHLVNWLDSESDHFSSNNHHAKYTLFHTTALILATKEWKYLVSDDNSVCTAI